MFSILVTVLSLIAHDSLAAEDRRSDYRAALKFFKKHSPDYDESVWDRDDKAHHWAQRTVGEVSDVPRFLEAFKSALKYVEREFFDPQFAPRVNPRKEYFGLADRFAGDPKFFRQFKLGFENARKNIAIEIVVDEVIEAVEDASDCGLYLSTEDPDRPKNRKKNKKKPRADEEPLRKTKKYRTLEWPDEL